MKSIAVLVAVALMAIASVMAAPEVVITECRKSNMCKTGCRAVGKLASGVCHTEHFREDSSMMLTCIPAPHNAMCVYHAIYNRTTNSPNATCADKNLVWLNLMQCNVCRKWDFPGHDENVEQLDDEESDLFADPTATRMPHTRPPHTTRPHHTGNHTRHPHTTHPHHTGNHTRPPHTTRPHHTGTRHPHTTHPHHTGTRHPHTTRFPHTTHPHHTGNHTRHPHTTHPHHTGNHTRPPHTTRPHHTGTRHPHTTRFPHTTRPHPVKLGSMIITGCSKPGSLTLKYGCDDTCSQCAYTRTIQEKTCLTSEHFKKFAFGYGNPAPCKGQIVSMTYNNSDCAGTPKTTKKIFQDACESRRGNSHFFSCSSS